MSGTKKLDKIKNQINAKTDALEIQDIVETPNGFSMNAVVKREEGLPTLIRDKAIRTHMHYTTAAPRVVTRDALGPSYLDLAKKSVVDATANELFSRSIDYYKAKGIYGAYVDALTDFTCKGFENDIDDPDIKLFFDSWVFDTNFEEVVWWVAFDFFRVGFVRTYRVFGKYEPNINPYRLPGESTAKRAPGGVTSSYTGGVTSLAELLKIKGKYEKAARKNIWSKSYIPIAYTVLNPLAIEVKGSLMFGMESVVLKSAALAEVRKIMELPSSEQTPTDKDLIKLLPNDWKKAIEKGEDIPLDPKALGAVDYRKMPYERYPMPRGAKAFESVEYKESLVQADYSTLDGISNYILKITVGTDAHPVKTQEELEKVAALFDTTSKSFDVVWNHTLNVEKITSPEIASILGKEKYGQVNSDLDGAFGIRGLIDGSSVGGNAESVKLATKRIIEEVNYARRKIARWISNEYIAIAEAMDFTRIPKIRFDDMALKDEILMMSMVQGMIDRRIISYQTGLKKLGFDPKTILAELQEEKPLVQNGDIGIIGSPYNPKAVPALSEPILEEPDAVIDNDGPGVVDTGGPSKQPSGQQKTPEGVPSEGRPKKGGGSPKTKNLNPKVKAPKPKTPRQAASLSGEDSEEFLAGLKQRILNELSTEELLELASNLVNKN